VTNVINVEEAFESKIRNIEDKVRQAFNMDYDLEADIDLGVAYTFDDAVIVRDYMSDNYFLIEYSQVDDGIVFGEPKKVDMTFVTKRLMDRNPNVSVKTIQSVIDAWGDWAGSFTECVDALAGRPGIDDPEALCAWLHYQAEGKWPAEKAGKENRKKMRRKRTKVSKAEKHHDDREAHNPYGMGGQRQEVASTALQEQVDTWGDDAPDGTEGALEKVEAGQPLQEFEDNELMATHAACSMAIATAVQFHPDEREELGVLSDEQVDVADKLLDRTEEQMDKRDIELTSEYIVKSAVGAELTGPIVFKSKLKRIAYAAVLVPGEVDIDGESVTAEKVEDAAHEWMELYQNVDLQHTLNNVGVPVESYLLPADMSVKAVDGEEMELPKGTWILGNRLDEGTWDAVEKGELTGYSVMGMKRAALKSAEKENDITAALKKTLLRDLGDDWVPVYVSVVNKPAVPKAKFFALKAAEPEPESWFGKLKGAVAKMSGNPAEKEGRRFSKATIDRMKAAYDALTELIKEAEAEMEDKKKGETLFSKSTKGGDNEMTDEEIKQLVKDTVDEVAKSNETIKSTVGEVAKAAVEEVIQPLRDELEAVKAQAQSQLSDTGDQGDQGDQDDPSNQGDSSDGSDDGDQGNSPDDSSQKNDELEAFKTEVMDQLDALNKKLGVDSAALKGQDGGEDDDNKPPARETKRIERDLYGRRLQSIS